MSKAERRKRARQRARERERAAESAPVLESGGVANLSVASQFAEPEPAVHHEVTPTESDFITGPVVPRVPAPVRTARPEAAAGRLTTTASLPTARAAVEPDETETEGEGDDEELDEDLDEDGEDGEDGDEEELDEQDALFNLACAAVEEGDNLTWSEVVTWLLAAEVDDPRLALLASVVAPDDENSADVPKLSGARVLEKLALIGLEEIVQEARDTVAAAPKEAGESEEERALVRTTARELQAQAKRQLSRDGSQPVRSSDVRAAKAGRAVR